MIIKNIIFDLGGVLLNIDFKRAFDAFELIGFRGAEERFRHPDLQELLVDFETGVVCPVEMRAKFREITGFKCEQELFDKAWSAMLLDFPPERIKRVQELSKKYKTFLLSNTNPIHCKHFNDRLNREFGIESLDHIFQKAWYSHNLGYRKPDIRVFEKVLRKSRLSPGETLYIDDYEDNVKVAESLGMKGMVVNGKWTILEALEGY